jgi:hypothetical protein
MSGASDIIDCIWDSPHVKKVSDDAFDYHHTYVPGEKVPTWIIHPPEDITAVEGINMNTSTLEGFEPNNKNNYTVAGKRSNV